MFDIFKSWNTFYDRHAAGKELGEKLIGYKGKNPVVIAMPRGGVVVGYMVANKLSASLDVICVRKLPHPQNPELAIGAISEMDTEVFDDKIFTKYNLPEKTLNRLIEIEKKELKRRVVLYRKNKTLEYINGRIIIAVDDGLATGFTAKAAILSLNKFHPKELIFASPVCPEESLTRLQKSAQKVVCLHTPKELYSISDFYEVFSQTGDSEVIRLLESAKDIPSKRKYGNYA